MRTLAGGRRTPSGELSDSIRVMDARKISDIEVDHLVPEVMILGNEVMHEVAYDEDGNAVGANRIADREVIEQSSAGFDALYRRGEDFIEFFNREIVPLGHPMVVH
ncbi:DUF6879 family protein [Streptomyces sioyaensis]|uniref:DUF6879 family protein n=1 Tax=Streptomyces sioyaensis TaxID=67364 RepID=UPI0033CF3C82